MRSVPLWKGWGSLLFYEEWNNGRRKTKGENSHFNCHFFHENDQTTNVSLSLF